MNSSPPKNKREPFSKSWQRLLQSDKETWREQAEGFEFVSPSQIRNEELFLQALLEQPHEQVESDNTYQEVNKEKSSKSRLRLAWEALFRLPTSRLVLATSVSFLLLLGGFLWWKLTVPNPANNPNNALPGGWKGDNPSSQPSSFSGLHLGLWDKNKKRVRRLAQNEQIPPRGSLVFSFTLVPPGGCVYLFIKKPSGKVDFLYPLSQKQHRCFRYDGQTKLLEENNTLLQYPLPKEKGSLSFFWFQSARPISAKQLAWLRQKISPPAPVLEHLRQRQWLRGFAPFHLQIKEGK
jgi:hypothetical protein